MKKTYFTNEKVQGLTQEVLCQMARDSWVPDYVVGLTRGGLVPALLISHYLNVPMHTLRVNLRDHAVDSPESNLWMAEEAFGYISEDQRGSSGTRFDPDFRKNILIVDDMNDSGATLNWIKQDWQQSCLPNNPAWDSIWGSNVRFAVLVDNLASKFNSKVDYMGAEINKADEDQWIVFPWENWYSGL